MLSNHVDALCELVQFASEVDEENATEPEVDEITSNGKMDQSSTEPEAADDSNLVLDNGHVDPSLVEDNIAAHINPIDLVEAHDDGVESKFPTVAQTLSKPTIIDAAVQQKLINDLDYRGRELVAEKQVTRPSEGILPHWLVSQPKLGPGRKVLAWNLTFLAIAVALQKVES